LSASNRATFRRVSGGPFSLWAMSAAGLLYSRFSPGDDTGQSCVERKRLYA